MQSVLPYVLCSLRQTERGGGGSAYRKRHACIPDVVTRALLLSFFLSLRGVLRLPSISTFMIILSMRVQ